MSNVISMLMVFLKIAYKVLDKNSCELKNINYGNTRRTITYNTRWL